MFRSVALCMGRGVTPINNVYKACETKHSSTRKGRLAIVNLVLNKNDQ